MDTLPTELLLGIIDCLDLDQDSIAACNRINRRWHNLTHQRLYKQPRLDRLLSLEAFVNAIGTVSVPVVADEFKSHNLAGQPVRSQNQEQQNNSISNDVLRISQCNQHLPSYSLASSLTTTRRHPGRLVEMIDLSMLPHRWETVHIGHIQGLVQGCSHLSSLDLRDCSLLRDNAVQLIAESLGPRNLRSLVLSGCTKITDVAVLCICAHAVGLENLELSGCARLSDISILELGSAVIQPTQVHPLGFRNSGSASEAEVSWLQGTSQTIRSLDLSHCTRITDTGIRGLRQGAVGLMLLNLEGCYGVLGSVNDLETNEWEDLEDEDDLELDSDLDVLTY
ncbi:hypothetical protein BGZ88_010465 [Linnemannia elongata]|uniref:RNI-like protein n=1 Tax=Linnemannia elongata AG-77 TaxID=1314771 RepID=A0A197JUE1_9FUNG|nr:hypothetical protein BGZ88_010465 [Linnemannia elongata]KAK5808630.1 hypothetical protein F5H01DRAFT_352509 [Linnemannia elongata]OAQ27919.1 RNI-like protein [Linnemannia elongata AG-77]